MTLTITSYTGTSIAMFAWIGPENGPSGTYLDAFDKLSDPDKPDALVQIAFEQMENIFLRKSWWEGLPAAHRADLTRRIRSGVGLRIRAPGYYKRSVPLLAKATLVEQAKA